MPSSTEILPSTSQTLLGNNNGIQKRKRNGSVEGGFLSTQTRDINTNYRTTYSSLYRTPLGYESSGQQMNNEPANLPLLDQMYAHWVAGDDAIHKRRRCSDTGTDSLPVDQAHINSASTYFREAPNYPYIYPRPHNLRTSSSPHLPTYNTKEAFDHSTNLHPGMSTLDQLQLQAQIQLPCHICHKKPRYKDDLERFTFCQECGERTCNICVRECFNGLVDETITTGTGIEDTRFDMEFSDDNINDRNGHAKGNQEGASHGYHTPSFHGSGHGRSPMCDRRGGGTGPRRSRHKEKICSMCCVEKGEEGEVFCVGCVEEECL